MIKTANSQALCPPLISSTANRARYGSRFVWIILMMGMIIGLALLYCFEPAQSRFYPTCMFHRATGLLCPGCGSLRAMHQLLHGNLAAAFRFNGLLVGSLPFLAGFSARSAFRRLRREPVPPVRTAWLWAGLLVLVGFGVLRNLHLAGAPWITPWDS